MNITDKFLEKDEYYSEHFIKTQLYLHHTAGGHRPDWVIDGWNRDDDPKLKKPRVVGTAYVIGGKSITDPRDDFYDGRIYRAFDERSWAHHLGLSNSNNRILNQNSIGIEICNYGPLVKSKDGKFYNYVNKPVPEDMVVKLEKPFRDYIYYHAYTEKQIAELKQLILAILKSNPGINKATPLTTIDGFEKNSEALKGYSGIYSHSNVRADKFDLSPQPKLIEMLRSIL